MRNKLYMEVKCHSCTNTYKINLKSIDLFLYDENNISSLLAENGWGSIGDNKVCNKCLENLNRILPQSAQSIKPSESESSPTHLKMRLA